MLKIEIERRRRGWSQSELARQSGVHASSISLIERRRYLPGAIQLEKLRAALGAPQGQDLLEEVETEIDRAPATR